jgi:phytoene synthase
MSTVLQQPPAMVPTASQLAVAYSVCQGIARQTAKNFYYGFLVLPQPKREAICAVYAFMRRCDDITDDPSHSLRERRIRLATWLDEFYRVQAGGATDDAVLLALADAQRRYNIPVTLLEQLAQGTEMDLVSNRESGTPVPALVGVTVQYAKFDDLCLYCYRVASVVGLVCIRIFGYREAKAEGLAERLGIAFQLTNILRDVKEDAGLGRVYLPEEDLQQFGLSAADLVQGADPARIRPLLELEADRAQDFYRAGDELVPLVDEDSQPALWTLITIYHTLLEKIARRNYDVFTERVALGRLEKLTILTKGLLKRLA